MAVKIQMIPLSKLEFNTGQIPDVPKNPRFIKDHRYQKLKKSIIEDPEMLELREMIVFPFQDKFVVIAGNQRLSVAQELNHKTAPCKILSPDIPAEKLKRYIIKDNIAFGEADWDSLANEWNENDLIDWGVEMPFFDNNIQQNMDERDNYEGMPEFEPQDTPYAIKIQFRNEEDREKFVDLTKLEFTKKFEAINSIWSCWWPHRERRDIDSLRYDKSEKEG